jgi:CheY-like chemotaxis protein
MIRILYADDDKDSRLWTARLLEQAGYECVTVSDGLLAIQQLGEREFDCVISDLDMQGNTSLEFIRSVPQLRPGLPVIIVTGHPSVETAVAALQLPVMAYLLKPFNPDDLLHEVRQAVLRTVLLRQVEQMHAGQTHTLKDMTKIMESLRQGSRVATETPMGVFLTVTYRNVLNSLLGLKTVIEHSMSSSVCDNNKESVAAGYSPLLLVDALHETIGVLEKTKDAFRSRDLGDLRKKLEKLLATDAEHRIN